MRPLVLLLCGFAVGCGGDSSEPQDEQSDPCAGYENAASTGTVTLRVYNARASAYDLETSCEPEAGIGSRCRGHAHGCVAFGVGKSAEQDRRADELPHSGDREHDA